MDVLKFLQDYSVAIVIVSIVLVLVAYLLRVKNYDIILKAVLELIKEAEERYGAKKGELKYEYVASEIYSRLPLVLALVVTKPFLRQVIEEGVYLLKDFLDNEKMDKSFQED